MDGRKHTRMWRIFGRVSAALGLVLVCLAGFAGYLHLTGNFHAVIEGQLYRAAQVSPVNLEKWHNEHGVATVLNLRGENTGKDWYDAEVEATRRLGIRHIDFRMSAARALTQEQAQELIELMRDAPKPLLIHCMAGADRTGLAAALYVAAIDGGGEYAAERQLAPRYGHIVLPWVSRAFAMDQTWEDLEPWLGFTDS